MSDRDERRPDTFRPRGDPTRHRPMQNLESGFRSLRRAPRDGGRLLLIVRRVGGGERETPERTRLSPDAGVPGDAWSTRPPRDPNAQIAVMRKDVAELIANGQALTLFGDNLFVDLDISAYSLPVGTRLRVGGALVEVTPKPHNGCAKFKQRFGLDAVRFVAAKATRPENLRGIYWRVVEPGDVRIGDPIEVLSRALAVDNELPNCSGNVPSPSDEN